MLYGWDISTSIVGLATFQDDGTFASVHRCDLRKVDGMLAKADEFKRWLATDVVVNADEQNTHFVEERLGGFAAGRTSAQVIMKLGQFNAVCSYIIWTHSPMGQSGRHRQITYLHPSTWKAIMKHEGLIIPKGADKKAITLEFAIRKEPDFASFLEKNRNDRWQPWAYDLADAYCLGRSGYRRLCTASAS